MPDKSGHSGRSVQPEILRYSTPPWLKLAGIVALLIALAVAAGGIALRFHSSAETRTWTNEEAVETVRTITLSGIKGGGDTTLPGDVQALANAPIYAQVSGTVSRWTTDIGAKVKKGTLLAEIDPRPNAAALAGAKGQLARDSATLADAKANLQRYEALAAQNAISNQQLTTQQATVGADAGIVASDQANVDSATINLGYTRVVAPFDGIVTSRSVDVGNYVAAGSASGTPLFTVTDETKLRVYVHVPQTYSALVMPGMTANFTVPQYPNRTFVARLVASAGAVSSQSGTQLVQFEIDNSDGMLKPGDYAVMHFAPASGSSVIRVPATTLLFRDSGMMVATVDSTGHVLLKPIVIADDLGSSVDVGSGLSLSDRVIDNPPDSIQTGDFVHVAGTAGD